MRCGTSRSRLTSVTENNSLESEGLLQFVDNGTSLEFLDETNSSVEQKKTADDTEIDPVLETSGPGLELVKTKRRGGGYGTKLQDSGSLRKIVSIWRRDGVEKDGGQFWVGTAGRGRSQWLWGLDIPP